MESRRFNASWVYETEEDNVGRRRERYSGDRVLLRVDARLLCTAVCGRKGALVMIERWMPVVGHEKTYAVSDHGNVRSCDREWQQPSRRGTMHTHRIRGRLLRPGRATAGHQTVALGRDNSRLVHQLVLEAFLGLAPTDCEARHLDGNPANNRFDNLVWDSRSNNGRDKKWHDGCRTYRLSPTQVREIKTALLKPSLGLQRRLGHDYGVSESTISCIKLGKIHVDVYGD